MSLTLTINRVEKLDSNRVWKKPSTSMPTTRIFLARVFCDVFPYRIINIDIPRLWIKIMSLTLTVNRVEKLDGNRVWGKSCDPLPAPRTLLSASPFAPPPILAD